MSNFRTNLIMNGNQIIGARVENLANASIPAATAGDAGRLIYDSTNAKIRVNLGGSYQIFATETTAVMLQSNPGTQQSGAVNVSGPVRINDNNTAGGTRLYVDSTSNAPNSEPNATIRCSATYAPAISASSIQYYAVYAVSTNGSGITTTSLGSGNGLEAGSSSGIPILAVSLATNQPTIKAKAAASQTAPLFGAYNSSDSLIGGVYLDKIEIPGGVGTLRYTDTSFLGVGSGYYRPGGITDSFNRNNNTTTLGKTDDGQYWMPFVGTWGISSNRAYCVSNAAGDIALVETGIAEQTVQCKINGTLNSATVVAVPQVIFRALDNSNFLFINMNNGVLTLRKCDAGAISDLATFSVTTADNTDYTITVDCQGLTILVYLDGTLRITHTLASANYKYVANNYTKVGMRFGKAGSPATDARWDDFRVRQRAA